MIGSYFTLKALTGPSREALAGTFEQMADGLGGVHEQGQVGIQIIDPADRVEPQCWTLTLSEDSCRAKKGAAKKLAFELITDADTWLEIAQGRLAPLRAFVSGRMRVRGDVQFGTRILQHLADPRGHAEGERIE